MTDFNISNHGSLVLVSAVTDVARSWVREHVSSEGYQPNYPGVLVVEPRYLGDILAGMDEDQLTHA